MRVKRKESDTTIVSGRVNGELVATVVKGKILTDHHSRGINKGESEGGKFQH